MGLTESHSSIRKGDIQESDLENFLIEKFRSNPPVKSTYEAWKMGYLQGMMKAAEIESKSHSGAKAR